MVGRNQNGVENWAVEDIWVVKVIGIKINPDASWGKSTARFKGKQRKQMESQKSRPSKSFAHLSNSSELESGTYF